MVNQGEWINVNYVKTATQTVNAQLMQMNMHSVTTQCFVGPHLAPAATLLSATLLSDTLLLATLLSATPPSAALNYATLSYFALCYSAPGYATLSYTLCSAAVLLVRLASATLLSDTLLWATLLWAMLPSATLLSAFLRSATLLLAGLNYATLNYSKLNLPRRYKVLCLPWFWTIRSDKVLCLPGKKDPTTLTRLQSIVPAIQIANASSTHVAKGNTIIGIYAICEEIYLPNVILKTVFEHRP